MLAISIADSLQGPTALSEWGYPDTEAATAEAWQQMAAAQGWGNELSLADEASLWSTSWPTAAGLESWPGDAQLAELAAQAEASMALAMMSCTASAPAAKTHNKIAGKAKAAVKPAPACKAAAMASPLRVPLPQPLEMEPASHVEHEFELLEESQTVFEEPQKISAASSLRMPSGPGALLTSPHTSPTSTAPAPKPLALAAVTNHAPPGIVIKTAEVGGRPSSQVDWKIEDFRGKLQASMGRPVVSPAFAASGLSNLRLMVFPDARDAVKNARSHERKGLYSNMVKKGPLYCSLKLKADGLERDTVMTFSLVVGGIRKGPCTYDFSEQAVLGLEDFGVNWLDELDKSSGAIHVGIEIIEVQQK